MLARGIVRIAAVSAASVRARLPRIFSLSDRLLHDRMQILQRRRATERLATHVEIVRYRIVAALDRIGEAVQPVGKAEFVTIHHRREIEYEPRAIGELRQLGMRVAAHVSELLEIPTLVASTDLVGVFAASMGPLMEQRLGLQVLPLPLELPAVPIYMIWHETRRHDPAHRWLREVVAQELSRFAPG